MLTMMHGISGARWRTEDQLHLTLRYIGDVDRHQANDIAAILSAISSAPITLALEGLGHFDRKGVMDQLWAGVTPKDRVTSLHKKIDQAMVRLGLPPEGRAYVPHITMARFNRAGADISAFASLHSGLKSPEFICDHFTLYESHLGHKAAFYEAIAHYPLSNEGLCVFYPR